MRTLVRSKRFWFAALFATIGLSAYALRGDVQVRHGPHGLEAVQVYDTEFTVTDEVDDGPYVRYVASGIEARWVCAGEVQTQTVEATTWPVTLPPRCGYPGTLRIDRPPPVQANARIEGADKLVALSDVHGQYDLMVQLLRANGVIDAQGRWAFGDGHLVMAGDVFDRGPRVTEAFWHLYTLEQEARAAGGAVHFLLGNHEALVLRDDLRYLNGKYLRTAALLGVTYPALHGPDTVIGAWLRSKNTLLQVDDLLFLHAGVHSSYLALGLTPAQANERFRASLGLDKIQLAKDPVLQALHGSDGPIWYRGYFLDEGLRQQEVEAWLRQLGVAHVLVGHTSQPVVHPLFEGRVIAIDSSIKKGKYGELLFREQGTFTRGTPTGERLPLAPLETGH
ncbi:metallophosphoesterase [Arenimonas sp.]|uniref:metallophosphoesterase n=1 Tax=Arenimonas sp. TaxID=1872635 RepID=UPI002E317E80|nr:metallophosphoesterase [Arenimonas sp.]HEX4855131.1 metallophosphoesterase [Arenimonas sp.]